MERIIMIRKKNPVLSLKSVMAVIVLLVLLSLQMPASELKIIKNPTPNCEVKNNIRPLKLVKQITEEIDDEHFFARPRYLVPDDEGNLFVFDSGMAKIIKLDRNFGFVTMFLKQGRGPGEIVNILKGAPNLDFSPNGLLHISSPSNRKVIAFTKNGKFVREIANRDSFPPHIYRPAVDAEGRVYTLSTRGGAVDVYTPKGEFIKTLLDKNAYNRLVIYEASPYMASRLAEAGYDNTMYDTLPGNRFIIYVTNTSTIYIFKDLKLERQFDLLPKELLTNYKTVVSKQMKKYGPKEMENTFIPFFKLFFVDKDDDNFFYVDVPLRPHGLYKFNLKGELVTVLQALERGWFMAKRNGLFYGIRAKEGRVFAYKEEKKK
jgi:hypothetical protein